MRKKVNAEHELYVLHRSALLSDFRVRRTRHADEPEIQNLINDLHDYDKDHMMKDLRSFINYGADPGGRRIISYVAQSRGRVVGFAILKDEEEIEWLRSHYAIEDYIYYNHHARNEHASLYHFVLAASMNCHCRFFLKEILRLSQKMCVYYRVLPPYSPSSIYTKATLVNCFGSLFVVKPRRQIIFQNLDKLGEKAPEDRVLKVIDPPPALFMATPKLLNEPKTIVNARIIVVGASTTGLAVLETLYSCSKIRFTNLVLLSPDGLPGDVLEKPEPIVEKFLPKDYAYDFNYLSQLALRSCVSVIYGKLTAIDRKFKKITVSHGDQISYDYLIITTGLQYHTCYPSGVDINEMLRTSEIFYNTRRRFSVDYPNFIPPQNLFIINNRQSVSRALAWMRKHYLPFLKDNLEDACPKLYRRTDSYVSEDPEINSTLIVKRNQALYNSIHSDRKADQYRIVIYGSSLEAYTCINGLIALGVPAKYIYMIQPPKDNHQPCAFEDPEIKKAVESQMTSMGISVGYGFTLAQWNQSEDMKINMIKTVSFTSESKPLLMNCAALFSYHEKSVDLDLFDAVNNACIVFDSRIVIDSEFRTNDPSIRAAGPVTKLKRIYYNDYWRHEIANSQLIGHQLGNNILDIFDPDHRERSKLPLDDGQLLPQFPEPKIAGAVLPGGLHYLHVTKPHLWNFLDKHCGNSNSDRLIRTGTLRNPISYFALHVNQYNLIQTITCLSYKEFPATNYIQLYNLPECLLNHLVSRFDEGLINDLYEFLADSWPLAIFHDRFADLRAEVRELLKSCPILPGKSIEERVREALVDATEVDLKEMKKLKTAYTDDGYKKAVEEHLLRFINFNYNLLPMYAKPDIV